MNRIAMLVLFLLTAAAWAGEVPMDLQVAICKKVLKFDAGQPDAVLVVHAGDDKAARLFADSFRGAGFKATVAAQGELPGALGGVEVVFFCSGAEGAASKLPEGVLSMCGSAPPVERNQVAFGIAMEGGKPKLLVSYAAYTRSGHTLDSQVLGLARIIR